MKRIPSFILAAVMLAVLLLSVSAAGDETGSITANIRYNKNPVSGLDIDVLRVAAPNGDGQYDMTEPFRGLMLEQNGTEPALTAANANALSNHAGKNNIEGVKAQTDKTGTVVFSGLAKGIYLVRKTGGSSLYSMSPALVRIPSYIDGATEYDIDITPKIEYQGGGPSPSTTSVTVTKLWRDNDDQDGKRPPSIEVVLYMDGKPYKTATLSTMNGFQHTFLNLSRGRSYTVKEAKTDGYTSAYDESSGGTNIIIVNTLEEPPEDPDTPTPDPNDPNNPTPTPGPNDPNHPTPTPEPDDPNHPNNPTPKPDILHTPAPDGATVSIPVEKIWEDNDNAGETRPNDITVYLIRDSSIVAEISLSEENNWRSVFERLSPDAAYTIYEKAVSGYGAVYGGNAADGFTITNTSGGPGGDIPEPSKPGTPGEPPRDDMPHNPPEKIPQTGMLLWPVFALAAAGLILVLSSVFLTNKSKKLLAVSGFGLACIAVSAGLYLTSILDGKSAENNSAAILETLNSIVEEKTYEEIFMEDISPGEMRVENINGEGFVGSITIPELDLSLPVMSGWNDTKLKSAPCRYSGTAEDGNFIIMAHNYAQHFGGIKKLVKGDEVVFQDNLRQNTKYIVDKVETLTPYEHDRLTGSGYDLTLFTCTPGGSARVVVRCRKA